MSLTLLDDEPLLPPTPTVSAGRNWRERFHTALNEHEALSPEAMLDALLLKLPEDPVAVFKAITATLPKEVDVSTQPQLHHLFLLRIVNQATARGIDLSALLEGPVVEAETVPSWLR